MVNVLSATVLMKSRGGGDGGPRRGRILNVASAAGFVPGPGMAVYHATKAYLLSLSEAVAAELSVMGVTVTALCPGAHADGVLPRRRQRGADAAAAAADGPRTGVAAAGWRR
jgi:short-subunit dehydrogenase